MVIRIPSQPLSREQLDAAVESLNQVGGLYDLIAQVVAYQEGKRIEGETDGD